MTSNNTFGWITLVVWMAGSTWWHTCKIKQLCDAPLISAITIPAETPDLSPLQITDGNSFSLTSSGNFGFAKSGSEVSVYAVKNEIDSLQAYLAANPKKKVIITGNFSSVEINGSKWPDLGIARAEDIKRYFVEHGLPADMFITKGELQDDIQFSPDSLKGGIGFAFSDVIPVIENTLAEGQKYESIFKPLDLYFNTGSMEYIKTADNQKFVKEAKTYLAANKGKKLLLTGNTDNTGSEAINVVLSKKRADQVKLELIKAGLPEAQLETNSKGQTLPKESNDTMEGRAANRRVAVIVQ